MSSIFIFLLFPFIFPTFVRSFMPPPLFGQCPPAFYPDGSCAILHLCVDPHERCLNGICCEPIEMFPSMPFGYNFGMPLPATHLGQIGQELIPPRACMDFEESCIQFAQMCRLPSVAEVCLRTCGHCFGGFNFAGPYAPYGGIGGPSGAWMPPFNGK